MKTVSALGELMGLTETKPTGDITTDQEVVANVHQC